MHFDDDVLRTSTDEYPEHLRPRYKIVKKQLKEYEHGEQDPHVNLVTDNVADNQTSKQETITFVADSNSDDYIRDLWNVAGNNNPSKKNGRKIAKMERKLTPTLNRLYVPNEPYSTSYNRPQLIVNKANQPLKQRRSQVLSDDSIMQVFRGNAAFKEKTQSPDFTNRKYLLQSFPVPLFTIQSSIGKGSGFSDSGSGGYNSNRFSTGLANNGTGSYNENSAQIVFYSYRNQLASTPNQPSLKPVVNIMTQQVTPTESPIKEESRPEVFTIRTDNLLRRNDSMRQKYHRPIKVKHSNTNTTGMFDSYHTNNNRFNWYDLKNTFNKGQRSKGKVDFELGDLMEMRTTTTPETASDIQKIVNQSDQVRVEPIYLQSPIKQCDPQLNCRLPKCFCAGTSPPRK